MRTTALLGSFLVASAVLARVGAPSLAAHQIAFQLFVFLALVLDAVAIAAQMHRGAGARCRRCGRRAGGGRAHDRGGRSWLGGAFGLRAPRPGRRGSRARFTSDDAVIERAAEIWWLFAAMMPLNGAVFALDGILIGAGDTRFLMWGMLAAAAVYVPVAVTALHEGWGILGVWAGLAGLIAVRLRHLRPPLRGGALGVRTGAVRA